MAQNSVALNCPGCGASVTIDQKICEYCNRPIIISSFNSVASMPMPEINKYANAYRKELVKRPDNIELNKSIAFCYLKLKMYDKALSAFEKAIENNFDDSELYFYAAVCVLNGKKAFMTLRPAIDKILEYINAAIMIEPRGIYYYYMAYIKYDYFARKKFITNPDYKECIAMAASAGLSDIDIDQLYEILGVERPECI